MNIEITRHRELTRGGRRAVVELAHEGAVHIVRVWHSHQSWYTQPMQDAEPYRGQDPSVALRLYRQAVKRLKTAKEPYRTAKKRLFTAESPLGGVYTTEDDAVLLKAAEPALAA